MSPFCLIFFRAADPFKSDDFIADPFGGDPFKSDDPFAREPASAPSDPFKGDDPFSGGLTNGQADGESLTLNPTGCTPGHLNHGSCGHQKENKQLLGCKKLPHPPSSPNMPNSFGVNDKGSMLRRPVWLMDYNLHVRWLPI